jgi:glycosyltransferase involved in cell wall biosynthesis
MVLTPSEAIRREAVDYFGLAPHRVVATPLAADPSFVPSASGGPAPERPYLLFVGTLEPRKNLARMIEAWRQVKDKADLVVAGRARPDFPLPAPEPGLKLLGAVEEERLAALYSNAAACVYPSIYEGFGLPVLEAMQCGAPVIASNDPAIREVAGDAGLCVEATDVRAMAQAMLAVLTLEGKAESLRRAGFERARSFTWTRTAERTREVYDAAVELFAR